MTSCVFDTSQSTKHPIMPVILSALLAAVVIGVWGSSVKIQFKPISFSLRSRRKAPDIFETLPVQQVILHLHL